MSGLKWLSVEIKGFIQCVTKGRTLTKEFTETRSVLIFIKFKG